MITRLPLQKMIGILALLLIVVSLIVGIAAFLWFGKVQIINLPSNATILLNGQTVTTHDLIRLRPGRYLIGIESPRYTTPATPQYVSVLPFHTTSYKIALADRNSDDFIASLIGANGLYGRPEATRLTWSHNNTWAYTTIGPGSSTPIVLHYSNNTWQVAYYPAPGFQSNESLLPTDAINWLGGLNEKIQ